MREIIRLELEGIVSVYQLPYAMEYDVWQRLHPSQKRGMKVAEYENQITLNGYAAINGYFGSSSGVSGFASYLALGNGALNAVTVNDTALVNETKRLTPNSPSVVTGNVTTITAPLAYSTTNVTYTEGGLISGGSSTLGTGTLMSHLLFPFVAGSYINYNIVYTIIRY